MCGVELLILLKNDELNDEQMSKLIGIMEDSLKSVEDEQDRERIRKWIQLLKDREQDDQKNMEKDLQVIEDLLKDI